LEPAGGETVTIRLIVSLAAAALVLQAADLKAQGAFPAPLPGQAAPQAASPFPPVNGVPAAPARPAPSPSAFTTGAPPVGGGAFGAPPQQAGPPPGAEDCQKGFLPLRQDAEARANAIKAASKRKAPPQEACKLIGGYAQAEVRMIRFIEANAKKCGIPPQVGEQLKKGHAGTEQLQQRVCAVAAQAQQAPAGPSLSEVLGSASLPEAKPSKSRGGSTFDTLNGNVLAR
jgi:hypothetical protein